MAARGLDTQGLRVQLEAAFSHPDFARSTWGCVVAGAADGTVLYAKNPRKSLVPASNQKLYVAAAALAALGPDYRSRTEFMTRGTLRDGVLEGDLVVRGYGAFDLTACFPKEEAVSLRAARLNLALDNLATELKGEGIRAVSGRVVADCSPWTDMPRNSHYPSAAPLLFNDNTLNVEVQNSVLSHCPSTLNMFRIIPARSGVAQVRANSAADTIGVNVKYDSTDYWRLESGDPLAYYCGQLRTALEQRGIPVANQYLKAARGPLKPALVTRGFPLREILKGALTWSDNLRAEVLFLSLAYEVEGRANYANGARACRTALATAGMRLADFVPADGSGISRDNRVSAADTVDLLRWLRAEHYDVMRDALAVAGSTGTLKDRLTLRGVKGRIHAKTGSLRGIRAVSGYATTGAGEPLCFAFIGNDIPSDERAWAAIEQACRALCRYDGT